MRLGNIGMAVRGGVEGKRAAAEFGLRERASERQDQLGQMQLDQAKQNMELQALQQQHKKALGALMASNGEDVEPLKEWFKAYGTPGLQDIERGQDGAYTLKMTDGKARKIGDLDALATMTFMAMNPDTYIKNKMALANQKPVVVNEGGALVDPTGKQLYKNPKPNDGRGGKTPKEIQLYTFYEGKLRAAGFNPDFFDVYELMQQAKSNPQELATKLFAQAAKERDENFGNETDEQIRQRVIAAVKEMQAADLSGLRTRFNAKKDSKDGGKASPEKPKSSFSHLWGE